MKCGPHFENIMKNSKWSISVIKKEDEGISWSKNLL